MVDEKTRAAVEMKTFLKKAKKATDDNIMQVNTDRARRVYTDTAHGVIRFSKQQIVAGRWDRADRVRETVADWKKQAAINDAAYVARGREIAANTTDWDARDAAAAERHQEKLEYARQQTQWRKDIKAEREMVDAVVREQNCSVHDAVEVSHLVPEDDVRDAAGGDSTFHMFSRFFDFRRKAPILSAPAGTASTTSILAASVPSTPGRDSARRGTVNV